MNRVGRVLTCHINHKTISVVHDVFHRFLINKIVYVYELRLLIPELPCKAMR